MTNDQELVSLMGKALSALGQALKAVKKYDKEAMGAIANGEVSWDYSGHAFDERQAAVKEAHNQFAAYIQALVANEINKLKTDPLDE